MSAPTTSADLLDLKLMPAWVNEPARTNDYADHTGEDKSSFGHEGRGPRRGGEQRARSVKPHERRDDRKRPDQRRPERRSDHHEPREAPAPLPPVAVRFVPHPAAFESVIAQIKSNAVTYSVFALARLFLDKPERYDVRLTAAEGAQLHQLGENGPVATDQRILETSAFANAKDEFYCAEVTQTEPLKGNFSNVARDRASGTLLGPTNHHNYQPQLRNLYEQRYSRRMSFQDFQRGIEIVSDPSVVEEWKEQARSVTTYTSKNEEPPLTFKSLAEAEHHFRQQHLPAMWRSARELIITGVTSRRLPDRGLGRVIENAWATEVRSPSQMMAELAGGLRGAGLNIFRHRRGMLYVSPVRLRPFSHESSSVSASINNILTNVSEVPGINRKQLAEKLVAGIAEPAESDRIKLSLASDLRWLVSEGYLIEFNDGSLDLPRTKPPAAKPNETVLPAPVVAEVVENVVAAEHSEPAASLPEKETAEEEMPEVEVPSPS
ncbi:MAG: hypothetical protein ACR2HH_05555 [Chthoniobacterales bacterium]